MKQGPLGIYYLEYSLKLFPKSARQSIIGYTKGDLLDQLSTIEFSPEHILWLRECRTVGVLVQGNSEKVKSWINEHMPENFKEPIRD
jgi:hypothetical protein